MIVFIKRLFLDCVAEFEHPRLSLFTGDVELLVEEEVTPVPGVEMIAVVLRDCPPHEPQRHAHAVLPLQRSLECKLPLEDHLIFLKGMISFKQLQFTIFW